MLIYRRIMSFLLAMVMVAGMLPAAAPHAYASEEESVMEETISPVEETFLEETSALTEATEPETEVTEETEMSEETEAPAEQPSAPETMEETVPAETIGETVEVILEVDSVLSAAATSGTCGENLTWSLDRSGVLTISGNGAMEDYNTPNETPWAAYGDQIRKVDIKKGVTTVGAQTFGFENIEKVTLPDGLQSIGCYAFGGCTSLEEIVIPGSVSYIGEVAFSGCSWLTSFTVLDSSDRNAEIQFAGKNFLGYGVFNNCPSLETVKLGNTVKEIPDELFSMCGELHSVTFSDSLRSIGKYAFGYCGKLEEIKIPGSVSYIGEVAFANCGWLRSFTVLDSSDRNAEIQFAGKNSLGYGVFHDCPSLETVKLGNTVKEIPEYLFSGCEGLRSITFSDSLRSIGNYAFGGCARLEEIEIPGSVSYIGEVAFSGCSWLTSFTVLDSPDRNAEIQFAGKNSLGYGVFSYCTNLETVILGNTVKEIPDDLFSQCEGLRQVTFSDSLRSIGRYAFGGCTSLEEIVIPGSVSYIGEVAFSGCSNLNSFTVLDSPDKNAEIQFAGKNSLGYGVFSYCTNLATVNLGNTVKEIPDDLFSQCEGLRQVAFSDSLRSIGDYAFDNCIGLEKLMIPGSVTEIGAGAFANSGLKRITFFGDAPEFGTDENGGGVFAGVTTVAYYREDNETWTSGVMQSYGGEVTWIPYSDAFEVHAEPDLPWILSGKSLQLTTYHAAYDQAVDVDWEISEGSSFATVNAAGLVTAKTVTKTETIAITATARDTGAKTTITRKILPMNVTLDILLDGEIVAETLNVDVNAAEPVTLAARLAGEEIAVSWVSGDRTIATVENGVVSPQKPGTVTITAQDVLYGISGSVTLNIFYLDPAKTLTASVDAPSIGLQQGQQAQMTVFGTAELAASLLTFTSSDEAMAIVDEYGVITGGSKTGTVKITAAIQNDPMKRSVTVSIPIITAQTKMLTLDPGELLLNKADLTTKEARTFVVTPTAESEFDTMILTSKSLKWTSSNTGLATVKANSDGSATVTIAENKDGTAIITAQSTDLAKVTATMTLMVYDKAPKLENNKITLNPMAEAGAKVALLPGYDNEIQDVSIGSENFEVFYDDQTNLLTVKAAGTIKNGTVKTNVNITCTDEKTYPLELTVTVKNQIPAITVKQTTKLNLFYKDSETALVITAKDAEIVGLELTGTDDFVLDEDGVIRFADDLADKYSENIKYKPNTKATLLVYLEGYEQPATKMITIGTTATNAKLTTDPASSTANFHQKFGAEPVVRFKLYDKSTKQVLDLENNDIVNISGYTADVAVDSDEVSLTLVEAKKATLMVSVQMENWMYPVTVKHSVAVTDKDPTVKLGKTTLKLNTKLPEMTDSTSAVLTNGNLAITGFNHDNLFVTTAKEGSDAWYNARMIHVKYENAGGDEDIVAYIEPGQTPKAGTYTYTATPDVDGNLLKPVTIKVSVSSADPKVSLSAKGKLDAINPESQIVYTVNSISNADGNLEDVVLEQGEEWFILSDLDRNSSGKQYFTIGLREGVTYSTKQTYKIAFRYQICGEWFTSATLNIKVSQSALKIQATAEQYLPGQETVHLTLNLTTPEHAQAEQIRINEAKTAKELLAAVESRILEENLLEEAAAHAELKITIADSTCLKPGKTYKLGLDIIPVGQAMDAKITTVTVNIKVAK